MIKYVSGNIFDSKATALVNPVNCVGVMGRGLALEFKKRYPENFRIYAEACARGEVRPGRILVVPPVINFPTKRHWREPSRLEDITAGLQALRSVLGDSVAIPPLGCGLGGLPWPQVRNEIEKILSDYPCDIFIYGSDC